MALRNHPRVSEALRTRAREAALRVGYVPNPAFSRQARLRSGPNHAPMPLGFVIQRHPQSPPAPFPATQPFGDLRHQAALLGYDLQFFVENEPLSGERLDRTLYSRGIEALLVGPIFSPSLLQSLTWSRYSVVGCQSGYVRPPFHYVHWDVGRMMDRAIALCRERGYRRIGVVQYREAEPTEDHTDRYGALRLRMDRLRGTGTQLGMLDIWSDDPVAFLRWFDRFRPDAVVAQTSTPFWWLRDHGVLPGRDCGLLVLNLEPVPDAPQTVSGFSTSTGRTALLALRLLDAEVRAFERGLPEFPSRQLVEAPWVEGTTLPVRRAHPP